MSDIVKDSAEQEELIPKTPDEYFEALVHEAPLIPGDHGIPPGEMKISDADWFRPDLIQEGKDFVQRNFYSVMLAHCISLIWVFTFKPGRAVLLRTGNSDTANSRDRYLSTVLHIKLWYESDFIDKATRGGQDIYAVRKQHGAAARNYPKAEEPKTPELTDKQRKALLSLHEDLKCVKEDKIYLSELISGDKPTMPMSQYSMVITQFCFIGFIVLLPKAFGLADTRGMEGFVHNWAIFGRLLGIQDRFNLGIHYLRMERNSEDRLKGFSRIFQEIMLPNLKNADETAMHMWVSLLKGFNYYMNGLRLNGMLQFMLVHVAGVQTQKFKEIMNKKDKLSFKLIKFGTHPLGKSSLGRKWRNNSIRFSFYRAQRKYLPSWRNAGARVV